MQKLDGHVFQPLTPWLGTMGISGGTQWTARSGVEPDFERIRGKLGDSVEKCHMAIFRKVEKEQARFGASEGIEVEELRSLVSGKVRRDAVIRVVWEQRVARSSNQVHESSLIAAKGITRRLVVAPVDKHSGEGMLL